jgi:dsRNA-specific ribonuclease
MSIPPLPPVQSDATLAIFVHSSLKGTSPNDLFGDGERLAFIGRQVLNMAIAETWFEKRPMVDAPDLEVKCSFLSLMFKIPTRHSQG